MANDNGEALTYDIVSDRDAVVAKLAGSDEIEALTATMDVYDMNSIVMDLMKDPKAKEVIAPLISGAAAIFGDGEGGSEAANEAVTEEMSMAMMQYMPLRSMLGFSNGAVTGEMIDEMLKKMNE